MCHQSQKGLLGFFVGNTQQQKGYLIYVPISQNIVSSYDVVFDETISSGLAYTSRPYSEAIVTLLEVSCIPYAKSSHEQTGDIIAFAQFEEGYLFKNRRNLVEGESISASIDKSSAGNNSDD